MRRQAAALQALSKQMRAALDASDNALQLGSGQGMSGEAMEAVVQANIMTRTCMLAEVLPKVSHAVQLAG